MKRLPLGDAASYGVASPNGQLSVLRPANVASVPLIELVIPALNEETRLEGTLSRVVDFLATRSYAARVIVVDNGSVDRTVDIVRSFSGRAVGVDVIGCSRPGKGAAVRAGILATSAPIVGFCDADLATPIETIDEFIAEIHRGAKVVVASRVLDGARWIGPPHSWSRRGGAWLFHRVAKRVVPGIHDTQCGFKLFDGPTARALFSRCRIDGFAFDLEYLRLALAEGISVAERPVEWTNCPGSTLHNVKDAPRIAMDLIRLVRDTVKQATAENGLAEDGSSEQVHRFDPSSLAGQRILLLNWRDAKDPQAGGSEAYIGALATQFATSGADVTLFVSRPKESAADELVGGVRIVRKGGWSSVYLHAARFMLRHRDSFDAVVDASNGIPFFAPLFLKRRTAVVCLFHHVHQDQFRLYFGSIMSWLGRTLERVGTRIVYRGRPFVGVSASSRTGARRRLGYTGPIFVVPPGLSSPGQTRWSKSASPRISYVGRLVRHKRLEILFDVLPDLLKRIPDLSVDVVGDGPAREQLEGLLQRMGIDDRVHLHGYLETEQRDAVIQKTWLLVQPSVGEGFGISILEANALGTPALGFRVPGISDAILDGETGWLVDSPSELASTLEEAISILADPTVRESYATRCTGWASRFDWASTADRVASILMAERSRREQNRVGRRDRRRQIDVCTGAAMTGNTAKETWRLRMAFRRTDMWSAGEGSLSIVFYGADENEVIGAFARVGLATTQSQLTLVSTRQLLVGAGPGAWPEASVEPGRSRPLSVRG